MTAYIVLRDQWDPEFGYGSSQFMGAFATSEQAVELVDHHINEAVKKARSKLDEFLRLREETCKDEKHELVRECYFMDSDGDEYGTRFRVIKTEVIEN